MQRKLLTYDKANALKWYYEDNIDEYVYGLPYDWEYWGKTVDVELVEAPAEKEMPVYNLHGYRIPEWLFYDANPGEVYVPPFDVAKQLEAEHEPDSDDPNSCIGIPASWEGWGMVNKWTHYDTFDNYYLIDDSWWMPHWLVNPITNIKEEK